MGCDVTCPAGPSGPKGQDVRYIYINSIVFRYIKYLVFLQERHSKFKTTDMQTRHW